MEQFVKLTVYKKSPDGSYGTISMKLSDVKDNTGTPISLLLPGVKSTLTLSLKSTMIFSVNNYDLQEWGVVNADNPVYKMPIVINVQNINLFDLGIYSKIQSVKIISGGREYRAMVASTSISTSFSTSVFSALTEKLSELPKFLGPYSQLVLYMTDGSIWKFPFSMYQYQYQYDENKLILTIDSEAFNQ
jgi:hypothetical protein